MLGSLMSGLGGVVSGIGGIAGGIADRNVASSEYAISGAQQGALWGMIADLHGSIQPWVDQNANLRDTSQGSYEGMTSHDWYNKFVTGNEQEYKNSLRSGSRPTKDFKTKRNLQEKFSTMQAVQAGANLANYKRKSMLLKQISDDARKSRSIQASSNLLGMQQAVMGINPYEAVNVAQPSMLQRVGMVGQGVGTAAQGIGNMFSSMYGGGAGSVGGAGASGGF